MPDFRREHIFKKYLLSDILALSLCAFLSGIETDEEIETYGKEKFSFLKTFLSLLNGIPSHDTITRVFRILDKNKFAECLHKYWAEIMDFLQERHISMDGKVCRATNKGGKKKSGICIVTAWACEQNLCLGQLKIDEKSSKKTAIPSLIDDIDIKIFRRVVFIQLKSVYFIPR